MSHLVLENVSKSFKKTVVIEGMNLDIQSGEFVSLVGPSGCGKSTALRMIAGLEDLTAGSILIDERQVNHVLPKDRGVGFVFQSYALFPHMSVAANIGFGLKIRKVPLEDRKEKIKWAIDLLDLQGLENRLPRELSGGQRQRVAVGRALVLSPKILLMDEPLSNLDAKLRLKMRTEFKKLHKKIDSTIVYVTHDQVEAMTLSDRIAILHEGKLQQIATPEEIYLRPHNAFVAEFIGSPPINFLQGKAQGSSIETSLLTLDKPEKISHKEEYRIGIRPQDMHHESEDQERFGKKFFFSTTVQFVEPLGNENILICEQEDGQLLRIVVPSHIKIEEGRAHRFFMDADALHFFDPLSELRL